LTELTDIRHDRLLSRAKSLSARRRGGQDTDVARPAEATEDDQLARSLLSPLLSLFQDEGPLRPLLLDEEWLGELLPAEPREATEPLELVRTWSEVAPRLSTVLSRRRWRDHLARLKRSLPRTVARDHPDRLALREAQFWIGDRLATGPAALENVLLQVFFDLCCEQGFIDGWLPTWLAEAYELDPAELEREQAERRERRAVQRITHGPLPQLLTRELTPSIDEAVEQLLGEPIDTDLLADAAIEAALMDLDVDRQSELALRYDKAAQQATAERRVFEAFDLGLIFEVLATAGPVARRASWLLYSHAIDQAMAEASRGPT
jgi:hypothetical protein